MDISAIGMPLCSDHSFLQSGSMVPLCRQSPAGRAGNLSPLQGPASSETQMSAHSPPFYFGIILGTGNPLQVARSLALWQTSRLKQRWLRDEQKGRKGTSLSLKYTGRPLKLHNDTAIRGIQDSIDLKEWKQSITMLYKSLTNIATSHM